MYPTTKEEWWKLVDENWSDIKCILMKYAPVGKYITISEENNDVVLKNSDKPLMVNIVKMKLERNPKLASIFQLTWASAPNNRHIHDNVGWSIFCDLCSEDYLLYEGELNE